MRSTPSAFLEKRKPDAVPLLGLLGLVAAFFWSILTGTSYLGIDFPEWFHPFRQYAAVELRAGRFPFWNPYLFGGIPFFAMIDNAVLYPLNWLLIPLVRNGALSFLLLEWHTIAHVFLLGAGTYFFCREIGISRTGSFTAGMIWMFSGAIVHHVFHGGMIHTIAWLPFIMLLLVRTLDTLSLRMAVATGTVWGVAILAGHPQMFLYIAYLMGVYFIFCLIERLRSSAPVRESVRMTGLFIVIMVIGLGLSAAVFLPAYELIGFSQRGDVGYDTVASYTLHPRQLITFLIPDFFGRMTPTHWDYWGPQQEEYGLYWETYVYPGILPPLLAGAAVVMVRGRMVRFFAIVAALCFPLLFGDATPLFQWVNKAVPGFDLFRAHARLSMIIGFAVAVLAGFGLDALHNGWTDEAARRRFSRYLYALGGAAIIGVTGYLLAGSWLTDWLAGGIAYREQAQEAMGAQGGRFVLIWVLALALLAGWRWFRTRVPLLSIATVGLIAGDLFTAGMRFNPSSSGPETYFPYDDLVRALQQQQREDGGRVSYRAGSYGLLKRNAGVVFRIAALEGFASPLRLAQTTPPTTQDRVFDLMNVTFHIRMLEDGKTATFAHNDDALPRTFVVRNYAIAKNMETVARIMADATFNYRTTVTLDQSPAIPIPSDTAAAVERPVITYYEANGMDIKVELARPGILVVGEVYYPAWRAYVDGREERVYRADGILRAIPLPEGAHTVEFRYRSFSVFLGAVVSLIFLLTVLGTGLWRKKQG